jgi:hypothetical protein
MTLIRQSRTSGFIAIAAILLLSAGCVVGPNFKKPAPPTVPNYTPTAPTATSSTPNIPGPWPWKVGGLFGAVPTALLDRLYDLVARNRYRVFGRHDHCLTSRPEYRNSFVDS